MIWARLADRLSPLARVLVVYTFIRLALFVAVAAIVWSFGLDAIVLIAVALVGSGLLSYPLARRQRTQLAEQLQARRDRRAAAPQ